MLAHIFNAEMCNNLEMRPAQILHGES